jgi:hypothetical protein
MGLVPQHAQLQLEHVQVRYEAQHIFGYCWLAAVVLLLLQQAGRGIGHGHLCS